MNSAGKDLAKEKLLIGRSEWCKLPSLNLPAIKAKIDTGAKTSAIHAVNIQSTELKGEEYVLFDVNPLQSHDDLLISCKAKVIDRRYIISSNGHKEHRFVINTVLEIAGRSWQIELTLSNRDPLRYRMLLGREALNHRVLINPACACNQGNYSTETLHTLYSFI